MPQMMPYNWTLIFFSLLFILFILTSFNYFFYQPFFMDKSHSYILNKWNWKW